MEVSKIRGESVFDKLYAHLRDSVKLSTTTLKKHRKNWDTIIAFAQANNLEVDFTNHQSTSEFLCRFALNGKNLIDDCHSLPYSAKLISEYVKYGEVFSTLSSSNFTGAMSEEILKYLAEKKAEHIRLSSYQQYELHLSRFLFFLQKKGIEQVTDISLDVVHLYILQLSPENRSMMYVGVLMIKRFLKWLYDKGLITTNIAIRVPSIKTVNQPNLPSVYSKEEIAKLLSMVDRGNPKGKRDYLVLILASYLGMRSSDICNLSFSNIDWDANKINIIQRKTGYPASLPLLPEVGNAIVDYLKMGRPESEDTHLLLKSSPPFEPLQTVTVYNIVDMAFKKAGIDTSSKRHGPHSLRHSLASRMLEDHTAMPIISESLGHSNTNSTMYYLRVDITSLRACQLSTKEVNSSFYNQFA